MNEYTITIFWVLVFVWLTFRFIFRNAIRPYFCDEARFKIFALRDKLRRIEKSTPHNSEFPFRFMEDVLNSAICSIHTINFGSFILLIVYKEKYKEKYQLIENELAQFEKEAPSELKELDKEFGAILKRTAILNSPGWSLIFLFVTIMVKLFRLSSNPLERFKTESRTIIHRHHITA